MKYLLPIFALFPAFAIAADYQERRAPQAQIFVQPKAKPFVDDAYSPYRGVPEQVIEQPVYPAYENEVPEELLEVFSGEVEELQELPEARPLEQPSIEGKKAQLQILDKINTNVTELEVEIGSPEKHDYLEIDVKRCMSTPKQSREENLAFIEIFNTRNDNSKLLFRGWMFSSNPALNSLEHPLYDIVLLNCS